MSSFQIAAIVFAILFFIIRRVAKAAGNASNSSRGVQNSIQQRQVSGGVIHQPSTMQGLSPSEDQRLRDTLSLEDYLIYISQRRQILENQAARTAVSQEKLTYNRKMADELPDEVVENRKSHYSEEALTENYKKRHEQGLGVQHHQHKFGQANEKAYQKGAKNDAYDLPAGNVRGSRLSQIVGSKNDFRRFMLLKEVLDRKEEW